MTAPQDWATHWGCRCGCTRRVLHMHVHERAGRAEQPMSAHTSPQSRARFYTGSN